MLAWCGQRLQDHSLGALKVIIEPSRLGDNIDAEAIKSTIGAMIVRLARLSGLDTRTMSILAGFATCIHDVGKAHPQYQRVLRSLCGTDEDRISLAGHELLSAWVEYETLTNPLIAEIIGLDASEDTIRASLILAAGVALHHSARRSIFEAYYKLVRRLPTPLDGDFIQGASGITHLCLQALGYSIAERLVKAQLAFAARQPYPILNLIESMESLSRNEARAAELLAYMISLADNVDAWLHRRGFPSSVVRRFIRGDVS